MQTCGRAAGHADRSNRTNPPGVAGGYTGFCARLEACKCLHHADLLAREVPFENVPLGVTQTLGAALLTSLLVAIEHLVVAEHAGEVETHEVPFEVWTLVCVHSRRSDTNVV